MRIQITQIVLICTLLVSNLAIANSLYITDKFTIPVYQDKNSRNTPLKMLPSGSKVTVVNKQKDYSLVQDGDNVLGWVESKYLTNEKTAHSDYLQLSQKYKAAQQKIQDYETRLLEMQDLRKEARSADWLRNRLNENDKNEAALQQQIKLKDIAIADLKISYAQLENQVDKLRYAPESHKLQDNSPDQTGTGGTASPYYYSTGSAANFYTWLILSLAVTLIIGILMGFVLIDYKVRKKSPFVKSY